MPGLVCEAGGDQGPLACRFRGIGAVGVAAGALASSALHHLCAQRADAGLLEATPGRARCGQPQGYARPAEPVRPATTRPHGARSQAAKAEAKPVARATRVFIFIACNRPNLRRPRVCSSPPQEGWRGLRRLEKIMFEFNLTLQGISERRSRQLTCFLSCSRPSGLLVSLM